MNENHGNADDAYKKFAYDRADSDFSMSNTYARSAGQLAILINGGAATAVIAIFARPGGAEFTGPLKAILPWALGLYGLGALLGTVMMIIMTTAIETWAIHWMEQAEGKSGRKLAGKAETAYKYARACFLAAIICFVAGGVLVGIRL